jgi:hypothetical protein
LQNIFQTGPIGNTGALQAPLMQNLPQEKVNLEIKLTNKMELLQKYQRWSVKQLGKLEKKINKVNKYFNKMIKKMVEVDEEFGNRFLVPLKINMDKWIKSDTRAKIFMMFPTFVKVTILLTLSGNLRFFKDKIWSKLCVLLKKYLRVFHTHRIHFRPETEKYLID